MLHISLVNRSRGSSIIWLPDSGSRFTCYRDMSISLYAPCDCLFDANFPLQILSSCLVLVVSSLSVRYFNSFWNPLSSIPMSRTPGEPTTDPPHVDQELPTN